MAPTLAPCVYVTVENPNPLPINSWDEESVSSYTFPEWLDDDEVEVIKPAKATSNEDDGEDITEYTAGTDDDDMSERSEPLQELVVIRRRFSSSSSLNSSTHTGLVRSNSMTQLPRTVVSSAFATFLQDRLRTVTSNLEFLAALKGNTEVLVGANANNGNGEDGNSNRQVARVNPLARFMQARITTFQSNLEILPLLLTEQLDACLHLDLSRAGEEEHPCTCS